MIVNYLLNDLHIMTTSKALHSLTICRKVAGLISSSSLPGSTIATCRVVMVIAVWLSWLLLCGCHGYCCVVRCHLVLVLSVLHETHTSTVCSDLDVPDVCDFSVSLRIRSPSPDTAFWKQIIIMINSEKNTAFHSDLDLVPRFRNILFFLLWAQS